MANDAGWRGKRSDRAIDRPVSKNPLDHPGACGHWLSCRLRLMDRIHGVYLSAGACAHAEGGDICVRQPDCCGFFGLVHSARTGGCFHAGGNRDYYCVGGPGEYVETEGAANGAFTEGRSAVLPENCECGGRLRTIGN